MYTWRQIAKVVDLDIEMLRSLNPQYRRDIVPGATKKYAIRPAYWLIQVVSIAHAGFYLSYRTSELLTKRAVVDSNDDQPTFRKR